MPELKNIDQLPAKARERVSQYTRKLLDLHGENIESILVYGSAASPNFQPGVSNVNIAVIVRSLDFGVLQKSLKLSAWGNKRGFPAPLFLTRGYINTSVDVFPIEGSEIKESHIVIFGPDIFADLVVDVRHVRLFCEEQVKGKLLRLRQSYLDSQANPKLLRNLLIDSLNSLIPVFRQLVRLTGVQPAVEKDELLRQLAARFSINTEAFLAVHLDKNRPVPLNRALLHTHLKDYLHQLQQLADHIDHL